MDLYAYNAPSTSTEILVPVAYRGTNVDWRGLVANPARREVLFEGMLSQLSRAGFEDYGYSRIASFWADRALNGRTIPEVALDLGMSPHPAPPTPPQHRRRGSGKDRHEPTPTSTRQGEAERRLEPQIEAVLHLLSRVGAQMIYFDMDTRDVITIMKDPNASFGTDSAVRYPNQLTAHPRGGGSFSKILGDFVRKQGILTLAEALHKMTSLPSSTFHLEGRGPHHFQFEYRGGHEHLRRPPWRAGRNRLGVRKWRAGVRAESDRGGIPWPANPPTKYKECRR